jgi:ABC-type lipoprotein release transport system permease subunit
VLHKGLVLTAAGIGLGLPGAFFAARLMSSLLVDVSPADPWTFTTIPLVLGAVAVLASVLPAARAAAIDPAVTLRSE